MHSVRCHKCQSQWEYEPPLGRRDLCPSCHVDAKVCLNCAFYDSGAHHECRESQAEWVRDKSEGNFCGYFRGADSESPEQSGLEDHRRQLQSLFNQSEGASSNDETSEKSSLSAELEQFIANKQS